MSNDRVRSNSLGKLASLHDNIKKKANSDSNKILEEAKKKAAEKKIKNNEETTSNDNTEDVNNEKTTSNDNTKDVNKKEATSNDNTEDANNEEPTSNDNTKKETVTTSIVLDSNVHMKMSMYCKANKLSLSSVINNYLKNQYIPKKKVDDFLKNLF